MAKMKDFNNVLNNSTNFQNIAKKQFQKQVDSQLNTVLKNAGRMKKCCIIGTGKMEDFSLSFFVKNFDEVYLTDIDTTTVKQHMNITSDKIFFKEVEYTGFKQNKFFDQFSKKIITFRSFDEIETYLNDLLDRIKEYRFMEECNEQFDFVYVSPIYTQLVYNQVMFECSDLRANGYPEHLLKFIENKMLDEMIGVINRFNDNIVNLVTVDGTVVVLSDIFQMDVGSTFDVEIKNAIGDSYKVDSLYAEYKDKYGMGLGDYGLYDMDTKLSAKRSEWMIWPFTEKTNFVVKLKVYKKN